MDFTFRRVYRGSVQAVIFDLAGTTVDYGSCAPAGSFIELFQRHKMQITTAQAREPMGMSKKDHIRTILQMPAVSQQWKETHDQAWTEEDVESMYQDFIPIQMECLPNYGKLIPGTRKSFDELKNSGIKVGVTTGYNRDMLKIVVDGAADQGFAPDSAFCASDVPGGRPAPWMIFRSMEELGVYPAEAVVSFGDTIPDIESGLNAGVWTVGVAKTGNMIGLSQEEMSSMPEDELRERVKKAHKAMYQAGTHYVIDGVRDCMKAICEIGNWLADGKKP